MVRGENQLRRYACSCIPKLGYVPLNTFAAKSNTGSETLEARQHWKRTTVSDTRPTYADVLRWGSHWGQIPIPPRAMQRTSDDLQARRPIPSQVLESCNIPMRSDETTSIAGRSELPRRCAKQDEKKPLEWPIPLPCMSSVYVLTQANRLKVSFCTRMSFFSTIVGFSGTIPVNCGVSMYFHDKSMRQ